MGPENLGVSGLILASASACLLFTNLGLDIVGTRKIAGAKERPKEIIETIVALRWRIASFLFVLFAAYSVYLLLTTQQFYQAWLVGALYLSTSALNPIWILQGLEELPVQNRVMALTSLLAAAAYVLFFRPGMPAGSDIAVLAASNILALILLWHHVRSRTGSYFLGRFDIHAVKGLLLESKWAFAIQCSTFIYIHMDMILVASLTSFEQAGVYRAANALLTPVTLLTTISSSLLYPRLVVWLANDPKQMRERQIKISLIYLCLGSIALVAILFLAPFLISLLFGPQFGASTWPFIVLFASRVVLSIADVFAWGIMASGHDKFFAITTFLAASFSLPCNLYYIPRYGAIAAAAVNLVAQLMILTFAVYFSRRIYYKASALYLDQGKERESIL
jgi:O-antigen/teichoic acid export membrane protein